MYLPNSFSNPSSCGSSGGDEKSKKKKKGVALSTDPQSVAARQRRHRISDRFKILQSMVPGGSKMDTVSMLDEAIRYVKFLKTQIWLHQAMINFVEDPLTARINNVEPAYNSAVLPFYYQNVDLWEAPEVGLSETWYCGEEENGGFDACPWENN